MWDFSFVRSSSTKPIGVYAEHPRPLHLLHDRAARVARADDDHFLAAGDEVAAPRALDHRAREKPRSGDERERQQQVHDRDRPRQPHVVHGRDEIDGHVREERRDDDAARRAPHVVHGDVAPPAPVEAEEPGRRRP